MINYAPATTSQDELVNMFLMYKGDIDDILAKLVAAADDHFWRLPDDIGWADVGDLAEIKDKLDEVLRFVNSAVQ